RLLRIDRIRVQRASVLLSESKYGLAPRATSYASRCCVPRQSSTPSTFTRLHERHRPFPPRLLYPATSSYTPPHFRSVTYYPRVPQRHDYPRSAIQILTRPFLLPPSSSPSRRPHYATTTGPITTAAGIVGTTLSLNSRLAARFPTIGSSP
ncbi:hypothetical protein C8J57DRAFT_1482887, partial [Mycena rebaudengoi]